MSISTHFASSGSTVVSIHTTAATAVRKASAMQTGRRSLPKTGLRLFAKK